MTITQAFNVDFWLKNLQTEKTKPFLFYAPIWIDSIPVDASTKQTNLDAVKLTSGLYVLKIENTEGQIAIKKLLRNDEFSIVSVIFY